MMWDDVPAATAILDRFLQHATIIQITGKSYRLRNGKEEPAAKGKPGKKDLEGRPAADGERFSPPEDTDAHPPLSSEVEGSCDQGVTR